MKKSFILFSALFIYSTCFAAFEIKNPTIKAAEIFLPSGKTGQKISLMELSTVTVTDFERLSGRHMKFLDRLAFKSHQKKLKNSIAKDGTIKNKKLIKAMGDGDPTTGFHVGGFLLGFLLPLIGVGIAYLIGGEEDIRRNRVRWAWRGSALILAILSLTFALTKDRGY